MAEIISGWHLVLFSDGSYDLRAAGRRLRKQSEASGIFSSVTLHNKKTLSKSNKDFYFFLKDFVYRNPKGYGKWIWKPYLILEKLNEIPSNHGVVYLDSGCYLNLKTESARLRMTEYLTMAQENGSLAMQLYDFQFSSHDLTDLRHSKPFLKDFPHIEEEHFKTNQVQAGILFFTKSAKNLEFISHWDELTSHYNKLLSDNIYLVRNKMPIEDFRWDQSIFSLLYKQSKMFSIIDETYFFPNWIQGQDYPIWAMRWKRGSDPLRFNLKDMPNNFMSIVLSIIRRANASVRYKSSLIVRLVKSCL